MKYRWVKRVSVWIVALVFVLNTLTPVYAADTIAAKEGTEDVKKATTTELKLEQIFSANYPDGNQVKYTVTVKDEEGNPVDGNGEAVVYYDGNSSKTAAYENGVYTFTRNYSTSTKTYSVHAEYTGSDEYESSSSETVTVSVIRPDLRNHVSATPSGEGQSTGTITVDGDYQKIEYRKDGSSDWITATGTTITGLEAGKYYVSSSAYQVGNDIYVKSSSQTVTVPRADGSQCVVSLAPDDNVKWTGQTYFVLPVNGSRSVYVRPADKYYISKVTAVPAENAEITYNDSTGEVWIDNITGDITLTATAEEKAVPVSLEVSYQFAANGNANGTYSEVNPAARVEFTVTVRDQSGNPVPNTNVYFKNDKAEVSAGQIRQTDQNGTVTFSHVYALGEWGRRGDYTAVFALGSDFSDIVAEQPIHIVQQKKAGLNLYTSQIVATAPGENNGKVIDVPANYELFTGDAPQNAIVIGSGEWIRPVNGEFTGLSARQYIIRAGEWEDYENDTFYLASDYTDFFVPRGLWNVKVDTENSEYVIFTGETWQTAEPGGTVYIYVNPIEGYEITAYTVDRPNYLSGGIRYSEKNGYIILKGISGSIVLTVKAEQIPEETEPEPEEAKPDPEPPVKPEETEPEPELPTPSEKEEPQPEETKPEPEQPVLPAETEPAEISSELPAPPAAAATGLPIPSVTAAENNVPAADRAAAITVPATENPVSPAETVTEASEEIPSAAETEAVRGGTRIIEEEEVPLAAAPPAEKKTGESGSVLFPVLWISLLGLLFIGIRKLGARKSRQHSS